MKSFFSFITEARTSQASQQAKKLGLVGNGHGEWLDRSGKVVARTMDGRLQFLDSRQKASDQMSSPQPETSPVMPASSQMAGSPGVEMEKGRGQQLSPTRKEKRQLTVVFGRFNPPTIGHEITLNLASKAAAGGELKIYPSRTQDPKKNPLDPDIKVQYMKMMYPDYEDNIINDPEMNTIFDVLIAANQEGYTHINIICGADRQAEFDNLAQKHNGELYNYEEIRVISSGIRDDEAAGSKGISASKMRKAVIDNNFKVFRKGTPKTLNDGETMSLFDHVRKGMGIKKRKVNKESYSLWEIAPEEDILNLRENYVKGNIFKIGETVQSLNTGLVGNIIRRGTNHLICVTEEGYMFKSWIKDLMEYTEVENSNLMRDKKHPNTLVGTLGTFKNYAKMTPGAIGTNSKYLQSGGHPYGVNFINKYRKIKESICSNDQ